ncbi:MAG: DinB family protein [Calditrichaeota bacterium]|nr:DinB family protein [Calditrichota bacterium]
MTLADLKHLLHYTRWANSVILEELLTHGRTPVRAVTWFAHILAAEHLWLDRLMEESQRHVVWPDWKVYECDEQFKELEKRWSVFLESLSDADLDREVTYTNTEGKPFTNTVREILLHIVLHAPHHRGQINAELRAEGITPPWVDYIQAVRTKQL